MPARWTPFPDLCAMTEPHRLSPDDLEPSIGAPERAALAHVAERLINERPAPRAGFRAELRGHARPRSPRPTPAPAWLWGRVTALMLSGGGLLALVGLGVGGAGPFAP
jgi:hypothetical protein